MESCITAIGVSNPEYKIAQSDIYEFMVEAHQLKKTEADRLKVIYENSGIDFRHSVIGDFGKKNGEYLFFKNTKDLEPFPTTIDRIKKYEISAADVCVDAVHDCLKKYPGFSLTDITHLITVSCTGMHAPGIDIELVEKLELNKSVERTCINFMGCYGAFNALKVADYICRADETASVLIVDVELCTLHFQKTNNIDNWLANALFADGASAVIVEPAAKANRGLKLKKFYTELVTEARNDMAWNIGNFGFEMKLSTHVSKKIKKAINSITSKLLNKVELSMNDIDRFAIHPGGRRILEVCEEEFHRVKDINQHSYHVLKNFGNMSSATILFVLNELMNDTTKQNRDSNILSFAFGPGLTFESMILQAV
jgi:predicted naringenin-chalcone synthase